MKGLPRGTFDQLIRQHHADKYSKRFGHWDHLLAMLYAQLSGTTGLRPVETGFNSQVAHHYHLGTGCIKRSTLADYGLWRDCLVSRSLRNESCELMYLLDSTSITLKGREFDRWTLADRTRNTQGVKHHVLFNGFTQTPHWYRLSAANVKDVQLSGEVPLRKEALYVFDKGYCDDNWWHRIDTAGARFVTRFKKNAALVAVEERTIPPDATDSVLADCIVRFKSKHPGGNRLNLYDKPLRCITIVRHDKPTPLVLATNDLTSPALEIAQRYKERWAIELFFKWVKQHLKIEQFLGRSENAVRIQLLTALISHLLVALYKQRNGFKQSLWECLCLIRATLFQRPEIEEFIHRRRRRDATKMAQLQPELF